MFADPSRRLLAVLFCAFASFASAAPAAATITASGFSSTGLAMDGWQWLASERGDATISWTFADERIATDDLTLHVDGLAAFPANSDGRLQLKVRYGFPGTAQMGGVYEEATLTLSEAPAAPALVGVPVSGDLRISATMMDAIAPAARRLSIRIEQADNPGISVAFASDSVTLTPIAPYSEPGLGANMFESNGDVIAGWSWLRDARLESHAAWRIDGVRLGEGGVRLAITALATTGLDGPRGVDAWFRLRYGTRPSVLDGRGGHSISVRLSNVSAPDDPVGYTTRGTIVLPASALGGAQSKVSLYLRVERPTERGPHVAFRRDSVRVLLGSSD